MLINTTRFGPLEVDGDRIITFKDGPLGFPNHQRFALIQTSPDGVLLVAVGGRPDSGVCGL